MKRNSIVILVAIMAALVLAACGGGGDQDADEAPAASAAQAPVSTDPASTGATIDVAAQEYSFTPAELSAPADTEVTVNLSNQGGLEHDWAIKDQDTKIVASPGQSASGTFNLPAGTYTFYCSIPGHEAAGMTGTLTVG